VRLAVFLPFLASALFALVGPGLLRRARPSVSVWAATIGAGVAAAGSTWSLCLLVASLLDPGTGLVEEVAGDRAASRLLTAVPRLTQALAVLAVPLLAAVGWRLWHMVVGRRRLYRTLRAACLGSGGSDLVVLDDPVPEAFALPGRPPYVVVSSGMLGALPAAERRVLLAHERAHIADGHSWHLALADAAAALNPLLFRVRQISVYMCERWADERAAVAVADRGLAAKALARAALAAEHQRQSRAKLAFHEHDVAGRVAALGRPPVRHRLVLILLPLLLAFSVGMLLSEIDATRDLLSMLSGLA
jgi:hypothetical protein